MIRVEEQRRPLGNTRTTGRTARILGKRGPVGADASDRLEREVKPMLRNGWNLLVNWTRDEEGASLVEYVLMVALIAVVCIAAVTLLGVEAQKKFNTTANAIKG